MVSAKLKTTFIKMVRKYSARWDDGSRYGFEETAKKLGYEVTSTTEGVSVWKDALREIWENEEEDSIILFCYSPHTSVPYYLKFIEEYTGIRSDLMGLRTIKKRIEGVSIGIDRMGYEEIDGPIREDVTWKGFIDWAGVTTIPVDKVEFKTSIKGGWIFRKPIRIPEPYNMTLPPTLVKNLKKAMKELKPTL